jgi:hypothetical protein
MKMNPSDSVLRVSVSSAPSFFAQSHKAFFRTGYRGQVPLVRLARTEIRVREEGLRGPRLQLPVMTHATLNQVRSLAGSG